eukprot:1158846-Pelagomonas_calceolata.AAC.9
MPVTSALEGQEKNMLEVRHVCQLLSLFWLGGLGMYLGTRPCCQAPAGFGNAGRLALVEMILALDLALALALALLK